MPERDYRDKWSAQPFELRAGANDGVHVSGYAAVFNQRANIGGMFSEVIAPGAFARSLSGDVVFLINHEGLPLARTTSGTLDLAEDDHGLKMGSTLDALDPDVLSITGKMKRGDLNKMSFAFSADVEEWDDTGDIPLRTIKEATLYDVSIVTSPAFEGTEIGLRSLTRWRSEERRKRNFTAAQRRLRMKMTLDLKARENG